VAKLVSIVSLIGCLAGGAVLLGNLWAEETPSKSSSPTEKQDDRMVLIPAISFRIGNDVSSHADQRPAHEVALDAFWIDRHEVTNRQFAKFVEATGYVTDAQRRGWSYVFDRQEKQWIKCSGANWRHPGGPDTSLELRQNHPVVHVSWFDARAYARWIGGALPTEAQWEGAARAGLRDGPFPWGREERPDGRYQANYWQGWFPDEDLAVDGFDRAAPVKSYPPNGFGLHDVSGNVKEWCRDWYAEDYYDARARNNPTGPVEGVFRVCRGGSWLSAENHFPAHRVSARDKHVPRESYQDVGFRCVREAGPDRY